MSSHMFGASDSADSAGVPWEGRSFAANPHAGDDGTAPAQLAEAQAAFCSGNGAIESVVDAFRSSRVLIPLIAEAGDVGETADGLKVDKTQELSIVTVATPDGRTALPVFSSVDAMRVWNPLARPVPVDGVRAALAAAGEGTPVIVLDPATPGQIALRRPAVWAIAKGEPWLPADRDPRIAEIIERSRTARVRGVAMRSGDPQNQLAGADLEVELVLDPGLDEASLNELIRTLTSAWFADTYFAEHVDQLGVKVVPAAS